MVQRRRILVTGSRLWTDRATIVLALAKAATKVLGEGETGDNLTVVHGAAMGADTLAAEAAPLMGMCVEAWPADWRREGRRAGPLRNKRMVAAGADICVAFPIGHSPGTRGCIREAEKSGIPVKVYEPARTR